MFINIYGVLTKVQFIWKKSKTFFRKYDANFAAHQKLLMEKFSALPAVSAGKRINGLEGIFLVSDTSTLVDCLPRK